MADFSALSATTPIDALPRGMTTAKNAQIRQTAQEFEAVFISEMLGHMFEGIGEDPLFGGGNAEAIYKSMLTQQYGTMLAKGNGIGISDQLAKFMIEMQGQ